MQKYIRFHKQYSKIENRNLIFNYVFYLILFLKKKFFIMKFNLI